MLGSRRRTTALFVLGVVASPWLSTALVALHLEGHGRDDHHARGPEPAPVAVHGHHHEAGTPEHHHYVTAPAPVPLPGRLLLAPLPAVALRAVGAAALGPARLPQAVSRVGHDPPHPAPTVSILRI